MKNLSKKSIILAIALIVWVGLTATAFGQAKSVGKEEFYKATGAASDLARKTFPRRETESKPNKTEVYVPDQREPVETILSRTSVTEFLTEDKIRYEITKVTTKGTIVTKRISINSKCYEMNGTKWVSYQYSCDGAGGIGTSGGGIEKVEYFVEDGQFDGKPVRTFRRIDTGKVYSDGEAAYINEYVFYTDSAGRLVKFEKLTRQGDGKPALQNSTAYEYDVKIAPIRVPSAGKK